MSILHIVTLPEFYLKNTYFLFQGKYYEQVYGAAMSFPISPLIANQFMEEFEVKALSTFPHPPRLWLRFMDDTFVIIKAEQCQQLLHHINSQDPHVQFTAEEPSARITSISGLLSHHRPQPNIPHNSILKTYTYRPIHALGQQPLYHSKTKYVQHIGTQGQNCFRQSGGTTQGTGSNQKGTPGLSIPPWALNQLQHNFNSKHNQDAIPNRTL